MGFYYDHEFDNGDGGKTSTGLCVQDLYNERTDTSRPCNKPSSSVVHPPDQFRHWCSILEQGGDCMHFEDIDEGSN